MNQTGRAGDALRGSRRQFLRGVGALGTGCVIAGCNSQTESNPVSQLTLNLFHTTAAYVDLQWDFETEVDLSIIHSKNEYDGVSDAELVTISPDGKTLLGEIPVGDMTWEKAGATETSEDTTIGSLSKDVRGRWGKFPRYIALRGDYVGKFTTPPLFGHTRTTYASLVTSGWERLTVSQWNEQTMVQLPGITD